MLKKNVCPDKAGGIQLTKDGRIHEFPQLQVKQSENITTGKSKANTREKFINKHYMVEEKERRGRSMLIFFLIAGN